MISISSLLKADQAISLAIFNQYLQNLLFFNI